MTSFDNPYSPNVLAADPIASNVGAMFRALRYAAISWVLSYLLFMGFEPYLQGLGLMPAVAIAVGLDTFTDNEQREAANLRLVLQLALAIPVLASLVAIGEMLGQTHSVVRPVSHTKDVGRVIGIGVNIALIAMLWRLSTRLQAFADAPSLKALAHAAAAYRPLHVFAAVITIFVCVIVAMLFAVAAVLPPDVARRLITGS